MTRALTVQQPWADAIAMGGKNIENRSKGFPSSYRGELLIHAGQRISERGMSDWRVQESWLSGVRTYGQRTGEIVAVCDLVDVHPDDGCCRPWGESSYRRHPKGSIVEVVHLELENVSSVSVPWTAGRLGLWKPPPELVAAVFPGRAPAETGRPPVRGTRRMRVCASCRDLIIETEDEGCRFFDQMSEAEIEAVDREIDAIIDACLREPHT